VNHEDLKGASAFAASAFGEDFFEVFEVFAVRFHCQRRNRRLLPEAFTEHADPVPAHDLLDLCGAERGSLESRLDGEHAASVVQVRNDYVLRGAIEAGYAALAHIQAQGM
jgi:hypothetical protein